MSSAERRLAAVMFTDMVGYTALGQANESLSLALADEQRVLIRPVLARHHGREVKTMGDAFLVEFSNALDAVRCAYDIQRSIREYNISMPAEQRIHLRVGVHLGDVVETHGDISGDAVNVASRIQPLAEDGGVCVTRQVYDQVQNKFELPLSSLGPKSLKNVTQPMELFKMVMPWGRDRQTGADQELDTKRIAVLPFTKISPNPDDEYFADGLTEELIARLSEIKGARVIARTSVMNYKKKEKTVLEIGSELGVGSIIEGSVRKAGNKIRITVQLIDARNEEHLWASNYDRELDDIFAIQSDVASKVAGSLKAGVFATGRRRDTDDVEAYTLYIRALQLLHEATQQSAREALTLLEKTVARDPKFARAYASLSEAWGQLAVTGAEDFIVSAAKAEVAAKKALELGPDREEAHAAMAHVHGLFDRFDDAVTESEKAIEINPNYADAYQSLGIEYSSLGDVKRGLEAFRKAYEMDPLSFRAANFTALVARVSGREAESLAILEKMKELNPRHPAVYIGFAELYMLRRDFSKAQEALDTARSIEPQHALVRLNQGILYALTGRKEETMGVMRSMANDHESVRLYGELFLNAAMGNFDDAFKALDRMTETHSWPFLVKTLPIFNDLRRDARFAQFCLKAGLPVG